MKRDKLLLVLAVIFGLFAFAACQDNNRQSEGEESELQTTEAQSFEQIQDERTNDITTTVKGTPELSTFSNRLDVAAVDDSLVQDKEYTVFAPNNEAYSYLYREHGENALTNVNHEDEIGFLIAEGAYTTDSLRQRLQENNGTFHIPTVQGEQLIVSMKDDELFIRGRTGSGAKIIEPDIDATNGVVHIISTVLLPGDIQTHVELQADQNQ